MYCSVKVYYKISVQSMLCNPVRLAVESKILKSVEVYEF